MLNSLFESELRVKLLNIFLLHPESKYCISQIASDITINAASIRREIDKLLKTGLIIETSAPQKPEDLEKIEENN